MPRKKVFKDLTTGQIKRGLVTMTRRITVPLIHKEQIEYTADVFENLVEKLRLVARSNSLRNYQKVTAAQRELIDTHYRLKEGWVDPRTRGAEMLEYTENGLADLNGLDQLDADLASGKAEKRLMNVRAKFWRNRNKKGVFTDG